MNKPHLTFANGLWGVLWPDLTTQNLDDVVETWGWVIQKNSLLSVNAVLNSFDAAEMDDE
jgi:hypothetical protein